MDGRRRLGSALLRILLLVLAAVATPRAATAEESELQVGFAVVPLDDASGAKVRAIVLTEDDPDPDGLAIVTIDRSAVRGEPPEAVGAGRSLQVVLVTAPASAAPRMEEKDRRAVDEAVEQAQAARKRVRVGFGREKDGSEPPIGVLRFDGPGRKPSGVLAFLPVAADDGPSLCRAIESDAGVPAIVLAAVAGGESPPKAATLASRVLAVLGRIDATDVFSLEPPEVSSLRVWSSAGAALGRKDERALVPKESVHVPMLRFSLGEHTVVTLPGFPTPAVAKTLEAQNRWVVCGAVADLGTFPTREEFRRGDLDEAYLGPDIGEKLYYAARDQELTRRPEPEVPPEQRAVTITGTRPLYLGANHGEALRSRIRELLEKVEGKVISEVLGRGGGLLLAPEVVATGASPRDLVARALIAHARRLQRHIPPEYLDEMEGIADTADVPFDAILVENTFLTLAEQPDKTAMLKMPARCTNLVATGEATSMGQLIHASTLDWGMGDVLKDRTVVLVMEPPTGHPFVSVTWPGMVGTLRAMSAQGIAITEESCAAPDDTTLDGLPVNLLMRKVVQHAGDLDSAVAMVREGPGTCGYKVTISDGRRLDARVVEVTARHSHVRRPDRGLLLGCDPLAACEGDCDPVIPREDGSSAKRYPAVRALLEAKHGSLRAGDLSAALATTDGGVLNDGTLLACLFEPQLARFSVALGDAVDPEGGKLAWTNYHLLSLLSPEKRAAYAPPWKVDSAGEVTVRPGLTVAGLTIEDVTLESPVCSGIECNDAVKAQLFRPADAKGVVVLMPPWKPGALAGERLVAMTLAAKRIATLVLPLPYQGGRAPDGVRSGEWTLSENLARTREAMLQGAADAARASRWLETQGFPPDRQAVMGTSLGGHAAAMAAGAYPDRFKTGVFLLAGAHVERAFLVPNGTTDRLSKRLLDKGVTPKEALDLVGIIDPGRYGLPERKDAVLLVACREDPVVPPEAVEGLAAAWGGARIDWYPGDHYGLLTHLGEALSSIGDFLLERFKAP